MPTKTLSIKTGDEVLIITGKDRSYKGSQRRGRVIEVFPDDERIIVDGINIQRRAMRQTQQVRQAGIVERPGPIHVSNVMLICPNCDAPTRIGYRIRQNGEKVRVCKQCDKDIDE
ncbi:MAG: 50S ribosomal protein L24 [Armatimonadota bacterium]